MQLSATFNTIYGELKGSLDAETVSQSNAYPSFYAKSDFINNSYWRKSPL